MIKEKKPFTVILHAILFFLVWVIILDKLPTFTSDNLAMSRLATELTSLLVVIFLTVVFNRLLEKPPLQIVNVQRLPQHLFFGLGFGVLWIGSALLALYILQAVRFEAMPGVPHLGVWLLALFANAAAIGFLFRGYIYQMLKRYMGTSVAWVLTSFFFTGLHTSAFLEGLLAVLNVFTLSLLLTALVEYTNGLITSIVAHFVWLAIGGIGFDAIRLSADFPSFYETVAIGSEYLSGGAFKLSGSVVMLIINVIFLYLISSIIRQRPQKQVVIEVEE